MDSRRSLRLAAMALTLAAIASSSPAHAGLNSGASAALSWSDTTIVSDLTPSGGTRTLYLRFDGIQSLKAFDVEIVWTPTGAADPAYELTGWDVPTAGTCQWLMRGTIVPFTGSTDSTFRIVATASQVDDSCSAGNVLRLSFANDPLGDFPPGRFALAYAITLDGSDATDTMSVGSPATILEGSVAPAPVARSLSPAFGWVGFPANYVLQGFNFIDSTGVDLVREGSSPIAGTVSVVNPTLANVHLAFAPADTGAWSVRVTNPGGNFAICPGEFFVVSPDTTGRTGGISLGAGRSVVIHVRPSALPLIGPKAINPASLTSGSLQLRSALVSTGVASIRCLWPEMTPQPLLVQRVAGIVDTLVDFGRYYELTYSSAVATGSAISSLRDLPDVLSAHRSGVAHTLTACSPIILDCGTGGALFSPSDPDFARLTTSQWYLGQGQDYADTYGGVIGEDSQTSCTWAVERQLAAGNSSVILGLVDSGIDTAHPDLAKTYSHGGSRILPGHNFLDGTSDVTDGYGHGTMMAGVAAAIRNNGTSYIDGAGTAHGTAGVVGGDVSQYGDSTGVRILPVKVLGSNNEFSPAGVAAGINWAALNGAKVINISIVTETAEEGSPLPPDQADPAMRDALNNALVLGATCVAGMGNAPDSLSRYPAKFAHWGLCIAVGGTAQCGNIVDSVDVMGQPYGSSLGSWVDVVAPSTYIYSTYPRAGGNLLGAATWYAMGPFGTSYATAITSGIAASLASLNPALEDTDIKNVLRATAVNWRGQQSYEVGAGRVAQRDAVRMVDPGLRQALQGDILATPSSIDSSHTVSLRIIASDLPNVPDNLYTNVKRFDLVYNVTFPQAYSTAPGATTPRAWVHVVHTKGWTLDNPHYFDYGGGAATNVTTTGATFTTSVYRIPSLGNVYVPNEPADARLVYRAIGTIGGTTSVDGALAGSGVSIRLLGSPVMAAGRVILQIHGLPDRDVHCGVFDVNGRLLSNVNGRTGPTGDLLLARDRAALVPRGGAGVYFVQVRQEDRSATSRLVVLQ